MNRLGLANASAHHHRFEPDAESLAWYLHREVIQPRWVTDG